MGQRESDAVSTLASLMQVGTEGMNVAPTVAAYDPGTNSALPQPKAASSTPKKDKDKGDRMPGAATSSYWSVPEQSEFPRLLASFGTNWGMISERLASKTTVMV